MDIQKEREAFEAWAYSKKWNIARVRDMALDHYVDDFVNGAWHGWQAKAQAAPDTYTPIVLALEAVQSKIAKTSFLTMDADNENEVYAVDANELHEYIAELIEAQQPSSTPDCPDEP